jgi:hypothetical protein
VLMAPTQDLPMIGLLASVHGYDRGVEYLHQNSESAAGM